MISIGRLGSGAQSADYYLSRASGCEADYYTGADNRRGVWLGNGARALGLTGELDQTGEAALRAMLAGRHPDGRQLLSPVLRLHPAARLQGAPLVAAIQAAAVVRGVEVPALLGDARMTTAYHGLARRCGGHSDGPRTTVAAVRAGELAAAAALDPYLVYRGADGSDAYAAALEHAAQRVDARRAGIDVTVSAPKSVSVLYGLAGPAIAADVRAAHAAAVAEALSYLEAHAAGALRGHHGDGQSAKRISTDGLTVAAFEHGISRAGDPQLHTHLVIPNLVHGSDRQWSATDTRALYRHAKTASSIYHAVLRGELTERLGVGWTTPRRGRAEIIGMPGALLRLFSTRRREIEAELARLGRSDPAAAQHACLTTRRTKARVAEASLRERWAARARESGHVPDRVLSGIIGRSRVPRQPDLDALGAEVLGPVGVTRHATTFDRRDLLQALCQTLPTGLPIDHQRLETLADRLLATREIVPLLARGDDGQRQYSTAELLATERQALLLAKFLRSQPGAPMDPVVVADATAGQWLSTDQTTLVRQLGSSTGIELIVGAAGTGKTAALAIAHRAWQAAGVAVQGVALAAITARRLEDATGIASSSLARVLADADELDPATARPTGLRAGGVIVVDEAGMVDTRRLCRLLRHAVTSGTQVVLVGDPQQLPEIEAGGLFAGLVAGGTALHLAGNRRQQDSWERDALADLRSGHVEAALDSYAAHGRIHAGGDASAVRAELIDDYLRARDDASSPYGVTILAATRTDVALLNALVRAALTRRGQLGSTALNIHLDIAAAGDPLDVRTGDLVIVGRNDNQLRLFNGTRGVVTDIHPGSRSLTLHTEDDRTVTLSAAWAASHDLRHAFAMTLHKAQGLTVDHALLYGSQALTREAGYVGLSRGRRENHVYTISGEASGRTGEYVFDAVHPVGDEAELTAALVRRLRTSRAHRLASRNQPQTGTWRSAAGVHEPRPARSEGISR